MLGRMLGTSDEDGHQLVEWGDAMLGNTDPEFTDYPVDLTDTDAATDAPESLDQGSSEITACVESVHLKNGKITTDFATWTSCDPVTDEDEDGAICFVAAGTFNFERYEAGGDPMFTDLENGSQDFALEITLDSSD